MYRLCSLHVIAIGLMGQDALMYHVCCEAVHQNEITLIAILFSLKLPAAVVMCLQSIDIKLDKKNISPSEQVSLKCMKSSNTEK